MKESRIGMGLSVIEMADSPGPCLKQDQNHYYMAFRHDRTENGTRHKHTGVMVVTVLILVVSIVILTLVLLDILL